VSTAPEPEARLAREILAAGTPQRLELPERGVSIAVMDWGGDGPLALLHHANGFCKGVFGLLVPALRRHFHVVAMDARGHGDSSAPGGPDAYAWDAFALDIVAVAERLVATHGVGCALGLGHSFGGTSMLGAASRRPGLFERLVLVDPVVPPPPADIPPERLEHVMGMAEAARRRRDTWPTRAEARQWWAERSLFAAWRPEALDLYVLDGLRDAQDGGVRLKCPGAVEGAVFASGGTLDVSALTRGLATPTLWLWARRGNFSREAYEGLAAGMAAARVETIDAGHLAPMEEPEQVVDAIERFCAGA